MNPRVGKQRRGSWTEKVARVFDRWRLKNYSDFKHISPSKMLVKKICQNWGIPYSETPKFGSSTIKKSQQIFLRGSCGASAGAPSFFVCKAEARVHRPQASRRKSQKKYQNRNGRFKDCGKVFLHLYLLKNEKIMGDNVYIFLYGIGKMRLNFRKVE